MLCPYGWRSWLVSKMGMSRAYQNGAFCCAENGRHCGAWLIRREKLRFGARRLKKRMGRFVWFENILKWRAGFCAEIEEKFLREIFVRGRGWGWGAVRGRWGGVKDYG